MKLERLASVFAALAACLSTVMAATPGDPALFPIVQNGKWGYMDARGKVAIKPQYDAAWDFSEGLASVQVGMKRGYINAANEMVIAPQFDMSRPFSEGLAAVCTKAMKWGDFIVFARDNSSRWVYIDKTGKTVIDPQAAIMAWEFGEGHARICFDMRGKPHEAMITTNGSRPAVGTPAGKFSEGLLACRLNNPKVGYVNTAYKDAFPVKFEAGGDFAEGLAPVAALADVGPTNAPGAKQEARWGYIDKTGSFVLAPKYQGARAFAGGLAPVKVDGKWGYIDKTGKIVIEPVYDSASPFSEGLGRVVKAGKHGYIDRTGKVVVEPKYDTGWEFSRGLARVIEGTKEGYVNARGEVVWPPSE